MVGYCPQCSCHQLERVLNHLWEYWSSHIKVQSWYSTIIMAVASNQLQDNTSWKLQCIQLVVDQSDSTRCNNYIVMCLHTYVAHNVGWIGRGDSIHRTNICRYDNTSQEITLCAQYHIIEESCSYLGTQRTMCTCIHGGYRHLVRQLCAPVISNRWVMLSHRALYQMG